LYLVLLPGCTPPVTPGFYGEYQTASCKLWDFPAAKTTCNGVLYFPTEDGVTLAPSATPCPVLLFFPGYLEPPVFYRSYGQQAASWGYVMLIAHFTGLFDRDAEEDMEDLFQWLRTHNAARGVLAGKLDLTRVGVAGQSIGGKYALMASLKEPSIGAVVGFDPVDGSAGFLPPTSLFCSFTPELMPQVLAPACFLGSETAGPLNPAEENYHEFFRYATSCLAEEVLVHDTDHASFVDDYAGLAQEVYDLLFGGHPTDDNLAKNVAARYMIAWFNVFLLDKTEFWTYLTGDKAMEDVASGSVSIKTNF